MAKTLNQKQKVQIISLQLFMVYCWTRSNLKYSKN